MGSVKVTLLLIIFLTVTFAQAQEKFISHCETYIDSTLDRDITWLKFSFKTSDCAQITKRLSSFESPDQFLPQVGFVNRRTPFPWTDGIPSIKQYYHPLLTEFTSYERLLRENYNIDRTKLFLSPEIYSEFENFTVIRKRGGDPTLSACATIKTFPFVKVLFIDYSELNEVLDCPAKTKPWLIISGEHIGLPHDKGRERIIGIESYMGKIEDLRYYRNLRYLGIYKSENEEGLSAIAQNFNLTHLSINTSHEIKNLSAIRHLKNLRFLSLTCVQELPWYDEGRFNLFQTCKNPYLKDLSFLTSLPWLNHLNLSYNKLKDVSFLTGMKRLEVLNLSNNEISSLPDLSHLKNLKELDVSKNPMVKK